MKIKDYSSAGVVEQKETSLNLKGFKEVENLFCDSSGFGSPGETALTADQLEKRVGELMAEYKTIYGAITEVGQFQVYITIYIKENEQEQEKLV